MTIAAYKNLFIPGYKALSKEQQLAFEQTPAGLQFVAFVNKYQADKKSMSWFDRIISPLFYPDDVQGFIKKNIALIKDCSEYQGILIQIFCSILLPRFPLLKHLNEESLKELANTAYSKSFVCAYHASAEDKEPIFEEWNKEFSRDFLTNEKLDEIEQNLAKEYVAFYSARANKLFQFFPLFNYSIDDQQPTVLTQLQNLYSSIPRTTSIQDLRNLEAEILGKFLFNYLNAACSFNPDFKQSNLSDFNKNQATLLAKKIILAFDESSPLMIDKWLVEYGEALTENCIAINGIRRIVKIDEASDLSAPFIDKFWKNKAVTGVWDLLNQLSEAHAFLTNMGFSSQNDNIVNTLLELYNTNRIKEEVHEAKAIFATLFTPLRPFLEEYRDIRLHEKNILIIFIRTIIPILIIIGFVIGVSVLLGPLALPEVVLAFLIIPILFAAAVTSSAYIFVKNWAYNACRVLYYGGDIEFQINTRMITAFKTKETAESICTFYINELKKCIDKEEHFLKIANDNSLSSQEIDERTANIKRRCNLYMEWDYIHSNGRLGIEVARTIALKRLNEDIDKTCLLMEAVWDKEDLPKIKPSIDAMLKHIQAIFKTTSIDNDSANSDKLKPSDLGKHYLSSQSFFTQQSKIHKDRACSLDSITKSIPCAPN